MRIDRFRPSPADLLQAARDFVAAGRSLAQFLDWARRRFYAALVQRYDVRPGETFPEERQALDGEKATLLANLKELDEADGHLASGPPIRHATPVALARSLTRPIVVALGLGLEWGTAFICIADFLGIDTQLGVSLTPRLLVAAGLAAGADLLMFHAARVLVRRSTLLDPLQLAGGTGRGARFGAAVVLLLLAGILTALRTGQIGGSRWFSFLSVLLPVFGAAIADRWLEESGRESPGIQDVAFAVAERWHIRTTRRGLARSRAKLERRVQRVEADLRHLDQLTQALRLQEELLADEAALQYDLATREQAIRAARPEAVRRFGGLRSLAIGLLLAGAGIWGAAQLRDEHRTYQPSGDTAPTVTHTAARALLSRHDSTRGIYVTAPAFAGSRFLELVEIAYGSEINAFVIDIKDDQGRVLHTSQLPLAQAGGRGLMSNEEVRQHLQVMRRNGLAAIGRIVVTKDPVLVRARPSWAIHLPGGAVWRDRRGAAWLDPFNDSVWAYAATLGREAVRLGFSEIQLDYARLPDADDQTRAQLLFPARAADRTGRDAVRDGLNQVRAILDTADVLLSVDVFGATTTAPHDFGVGQVWEDVAAVADIVSPMTYPSHYARGSFGIAQPNRAPYEVVRASLEHAVQRTARLDRKPAIRPWIQAFTLGEPAYGPDQVRAQLRAVKDVGLSSYVLWNPRSQYDPRAFGEAIAHAQTRPSETPHQAEDHRAQVALAR